MGCSCQKEELNPGEDQLYALGSGIKLRPAMTEITLKCLMKGYLVRKGAQKPKDQQQTVTHEYQSIEKPSGLGTQLDAKQILNYENQETRATLRRIGPFDYEKQKIDYGDL